MALGADKRALCGLHREDGHVIEEERVAKFKNSSENLEPSTQDRKPETLSTRVCFMKIPATELDMTYYSCDVMLHAVRL